MNLLHISSRLFFVLLLKSCLSAEYRWCEFEVYHYRRTWPEADAICKQNNKKLVHINGTSVHNYLASLVKTSVAKLDQYKTFDSEMWIGLYSTAGGGTSWADGNVYTSQAGYDPAYHDNRHTENTCFLIKTDDSKQFARKDCIERKQFICQATKIASSTCYMSLDVNNVTTLSISTDGTFGGKFKSVWFDKCNANANCIGINGKEPCLMYISIQSGSLQWIDTLFTKNLINYETDLPIIPYTSDIGGYDSALQTMQLTTSVVPSNTDEDTLTSSQFETSDVISDFTTRSNIAASSTETADFKTTLNAICASSTITSSVQVTRPFSQSTCNCRQNNTSLTTEQLQQKIQELKQELKVNKKDLSSYKRKLNSAADNRTSSRNIGYVGAAIIGGFFVLLLIMDFRRLVHDGKMLFHNVFGCKFKKKRRN